MEGIEFIGLENFKRLINDSLFVTSLKNNLIYAVIFVPVTMVLALILAVIMNQKIFGKELIRSLFFIPYITNIVAISTVWMAFYQPMSGPINKLLQSLGVKNVPLWLSDSDSAMISIIIVNIWLNVGYTMAVYLAGLQNIPQDLYEAAEIDGAGALKKFFYITLPCLSGTTFFVLVTTVINSFKVFGTINVMTKGGPGDATSVLVFYTYITAFRYYKMGYASAMSWILFIIIFTITLIQWKKQKKSEY